MCVKVTNKMSRTYDIYFVVYLHDSGVVKINNFGELSNFVTIGNMGDKEKIIEWYTAMIQETIDCLELDMKFSICAIDAKMTFCLTIAIKSCVFDDDQGIFEIAQQLTDPDDDGNYPVIYNGHYFLVEGKIIKLNLIKLDQT